MPNKKRPWANVNVLWFKRSEAHSQLSTKYQKSKPNEQPQITKTKIANAMTVKLRKVAGSFLRMPWIPLMDRITDACEAGADAYLYGPLSAVVRPCCKPILALGWFYGLHEVRGYAASLVERAKVTYYDPVEDDVRRYFARWEARAVAAAVSVAFAYVSAMYVYPAAVRDRVSMSWLMAAEDDGGTGTGTGGHPSYVSTVTKVDRATGEARECALVSKSIIKCVARQSEVAVWVLGTLLRIPKKRFLPLWATSQFAAPLAEGAAERAGNFALWMGMGTVAGRAFGLYPTEGERRLGDLGATAAVLATAALLPAHERVGRAEIALSTSAFVLAELAARYALFSLRVRADVLLSKFRAKKGEDGAGEKREPNVLVRAWRYVTHDETTHLSKDWPEFTYPSYGAWVGLVAAWSSLGLALDGV